MAYIQLILWERGQATQTSNTQTLRKSYAGERLSIQYRESESKKKLTANAALMAHILSETTRDESTLTYAANGI